MSRLTLSWSGIVRLGLVQTSLGAIVVLTTSTMNRVMVVELALPAMLPGALVALHYAMQVFRPRLGYGSDVGGRRTPWIVGGMAILGAGGIAAAVATAWMETNLTAGVTLAVAAFVLVGIGVGATGTTLLVLLAKQVDPGRRAAAATTVWVMMIAGFIVTTLIAGHLLDPFSTSRLVAVTIAVAVTAFLVAWLSIRNVEDPFAAEASPAPSAQHAAALPGFRAALQQVWGETRARRFTVFVFFSMLAFSAQDLILEPFAGTVFGYSPGESTRLAGVQQSGVLLGMLLVAAAGSTRSGARPAFMRNWTIGGCLASALALTGLAAAGMAGSGWPLRGTVFALGVTNGAYAVAAIGSMMSLARTGAESREGIRMGLWGAAQAIAFGMGGFLGTVAVDAARYLLESPAAAYSVVFALEATLFLVAAALAARLGEVDRVPPKPLAHGLSSAGGWQAARLTRG